MTLRCHLMLVRMAITLKNLQITSGREAVEKRECTYTVGGNVAGEVTVENSMEVPQKTKTRIST